MRHALSRSRCRKEVTGIDERRTAIIIGAGPAGLTAAYELLAKTDVKPIVLEVSGRVGGISGTIDYKGNKMDFGGHRFFSKSDAVMRWWLDILPLQSTASPPQAAGGAGDAATPDPEVLDDVMLVRSRLSRILFEGKLYDYPVSLSLQTLRNLGLPRTVKVAASYAKARLFPIREERSLQDFLINRFGEELYRFFFKDYTEKVWGVPCNEISPEWGAQRIKGLSVSKALAHALWSAVAKDASVEQRKTETSLIERFMYPKFGPGQLWEKVARMVVEGGGELHFGSEVTGIRHEAGRITAVEVRGQGGREASVYRGDFFFSSMPVKDLITAFGAGVPPRVSAVAAGLEYRNFITVGLLLEGLCLNGVRGRARGAGAVPDNWIYVQENDLKMSRIQVFNNWSPYMLKDADKLWVGLEYICGDDDDIWRMSEAEMKRFAVAEMAAMGAVGEGDVLDGVVARIPKAYPAYFGTWRDFGAVREFTDGFANLFLIGRNGMHRYNNQDHSMLTAMAAVENVASAVTGKENIWSVNVEESYHEA